MTELSNRIANRILNSDNFENVAYVCCDWEEFVFEVAEWGVDHIATVDFDSLDDNSVTIRSRDSMEQERILITDLPGFFSDL